jgi:hypothetical protein
MGKVIKTILLPLLLVSVLSLTVVLGCNDEKNEASGEFSQAELEQILADSTLLINQVDSYKMNMEMDMFMDIEGGGEQGSIDMDMTMEGAVDQKSLDLYMLVDIYMAMDMGGSQESLDDIAMDMYLKDEYIYMKMSIPELGEEWIKMPATEENMSDWNMNMVEQQMLPLESPLELTFLKYEKIKGSECYVIELAPDMAKVMEWLGEQELADLGFSWGDIDAISEIFDKLTYTCWIDKETKYMKKMTAYMLIKMDEDIVEDLSGETGNITMDMTMNIEMYDHNIPVSIVLPDEAENAMEMDDFIY